MCAIQIDKCISIYHTINVKSFKNKINIYYNVTIQYNDFSNG